MKKSTRKGENMEALKLLLIQDKISPSRREEVLSYLKLALKKDNLFIKVRNSLKKTNQYYAEFFAEEIKKIFNLEIDPDATREMLEIAIISVARDYYFQKVKSDAFDLLKNGFSREDVEKILRERFSQELS
ncbi:MAG: hypothetical protein EOM78_08745, partial [Erysipelotrichia bacterium]|nr:hypothetical protein [Erysipelotrichia bacterium]